MADAVPKVRIEAVRRFARFYTQRLGALDESLPDDSYSLAEIRILFELADAVTLTARDLAARLGLDRGYLSRMLHRLIDRRIVLTQYNPQDRRLILLSLSPLGRKVHGRLDEAVSREVAQLLGHMSDADQRRLLAAMKAVMALWPEA